LFIFIHIIGAHTTTITITTIQSTMPRAKSQKLFDRHETFYRRPLINNPDAKDTLTRAQVESMIHPVLGLFAIIVLLSNHTLMFLSLPLPHTDIGYLFSKHIETRKREIAQLGAQIARNAAESKRVAEEWAAQHPHDNLPVALRRSHNAIPRRERAWRAKEIRKLKILKNIDNSIATDIIKGNWNNYTNDPKSMILGDCAQSDTVSSKLQVRKLRFALLFAHKDEHYPWMRACDDKHLCALLMYHKLL
jgi:hypothetical protein